MIEFDEMAAEKDGVSWYAGMFSAETRLDIAWDDYDHCDYTNTVRRHLGFNEEVGVWLREHVGPNDWDIETDTQTGTITLFLLGHRNVVAFQLRWG